VAGFSAGGGAWWQRLLQARLNYFGRWASSALWKTRSNDGLGLVQVPGDRLAIMAAHFTGVY